MKHIWYILVVLCLFLLSSCTVNFKAKELELDSVPTLSFELETIELLQKGDQAHG